MILHKLSRPAASWRPTTVLCLSLCASYLFFCFGENTYEKWAAFIFHNPLGQIIYISLMLNLTAVSVRIACGRLKKSLPSVESIVKMDTFIEVPVTDAGALQTLSAWAENNGFSDGPNTGVMNASIGRFSFLPGTFMRMGLVMLMASVMISLHIRKAGEFVLHTGETVTYPDRKISLLSIKSDMPDEFLQIGEESVFRLHNVSAVVSSEGETYLLTSGLPVKIDGIYFRLSHLGFSQQISVRTPDVDFTKKQDLDILPPGKSDTVGLTPDGISLSVSLRPGKTVKKGVVAGSFFNLKEPEYNLVLQNGKERTESAVLKPGENMKSGKAALSLGGNSIFVKMTSAYDPAIPWMYAGLLIAITGLVSMTSRFFWYEKQLCSIIKGNVMMVGYSEEFYKKWGIQKFHMWEKNIRD